MAEHKAGYDKITHAERQRKGPWSAPTPPPSKGETEIERGILNDHTTGDCYSGDALPAQYRSQDGGDVREDRPPHGVKESDDPDTRFVG